MALSIFWTERAESGFADIVDYLDYHFTENEVRLFIEEVDDFLGILIVYPELLASTKNIDGVHRGPINAYTIITYRIDHEKNRIEIINLRSSRQKPQ
jgi:plasmid stabilization system protein ParE